MKKAGGDHKALRVADGSGLSLYNYATAEIEVMMLRYAFNNNDIYPYLYESLPIAGIDGTLRKRMRNSKAKLKRCLTHKKRLQSLWVWGERRCTPN